jgi:hypothetical protein
MPIRSLAVVSETMTGPSLEIAVQALQRSPTLRFASAVIAELTSPRRFRDMKIYRTDNSPQIVEIRDLEFTFRRPKIQDLCLKIPLRAAFCHLDALVRGTVVAVQASTSCWNGVRVKSLVSGEEDSQGLFSAEGEIAGMVVTDLDHSEVIHRITNMCLNEGDDGYAGYKTAGLRYQTDLEGAGIFGEHSAVVVADHSTADRSSGGRTVIFLSGTVPGMARFRDMVSGYNPVVKVKTVRRYPNAQSNIPRMERVDGPNMPMVLTGMQVVPEPPSSPPPSHLSFGTEGELDVGDSSDEGDEGDEGDESDSGDVPPPPPGAPPSPPTTPNVSQPAWRTVRASTDEDDETTVALSLIP